MHINSSYKLFTIYGPIAIHSYGLFIALGIIVSTYFMTLNKRFERLNINKHFPDIILVSIIAGIIGGRLLEVVSEPKLYPKFTDWVALWEGGFSALGSIIGAIIITPLYIKIIKAPILPIFDLTAIYAPLFQSIARLGCLAAGCCHGIPTQNLCAIIYSHKNTLAYYNCAIHPTQLYSSIFLFFIFLFMLFIAQHQLKKPGQLFTTYLMLASTERFLVDFWRADRIMIGQSWLSFHQIIAAILVCTSLIGFTWVSFCKQGNY